VLGRTEKTIPPAIAGRYLSYELKLGGGIGARGETGEGRTGGRRRRRV